MREAANGGGLKSAVRLFEQILASVPAIVKICVHGGWRVRQTAAMAMVFSVQADSSEECEAGLDLLCEALGLVPSLRPCRSVGTDRWMARAQARETQSVHLAD